MVALTRAVPAPMLAAMAGVFYPVLFVWLDWPGAPVRAHTGTGTITWGGYNWVGVGKFGEVSLPEESGSMVATSAVLSLIAAPEQMTAYLGDTIRNLPGEVYIGLVTDRPGKDGGTTLISTPVSVFVGAMDGMVMEVAPEEVGYSTKISLTLATGPGARSGATVRHSEADQKRRYPSDTAGRLVVLAAANQQKMFWPEN